jgi:hypothetical protein
MSSSTPSAHTPIILVHGTFAGPKEGSRQWYEPDSDFCRALDKALEKRGVHARCWAGIEPLEYFHWGPGTNDWLDRAEAAKRLRDYLHNRQGRCHVVAHSHGGNLLLDALGWNGGARVDWFSGTVVLLGTPILELPLQSAHRFVPILLLTGVMTLALVSFVRHPPPYGAYTLLPCAILPLIMYFVRKVKKFFDEAFDFSVGLYIPFPLIINSVHDEAYCFLNALAREPNPFIRPGKRHPLIPRVRRAVGRLWMESAPTNSKALVNPIPVLIILFCLSLIFTLLALGVVSTVIGFWCITAFVDWFNCT